jgi:peptide deformylase
LSYPGYHGFVKRANYVKIATLNRSGERIELEGEGFLARCIQHEIDHLNGVLFVDHIREPWLYEDQTQRRVSLLEVLKLSRSL